MRVVKYDDEKSFQDFLKAPINIGQFLFDFMLYSFFIGGIFLAVGFVQNVFAYERVLFNQGVGYATSSAGSVGKMISGATVANGWYEINCEALGISEIASTTVSLYVDASTRSAFNLMNWETGQLSDNSYTITTTATSYSYTFTPPIWCGEGSGGRVLLGGEEYATRPVNWSYKGASNVDQVPHAYCSGFGSGCTFSELRGADIAIIAEGSKATSTPTGGGVSTTTYNFYFSTSTLETTTGSTTIFVPLALLALFLFTVRFVANIMRVNM